MLRRRYQEGAASARAKLGVAQPSLGAVGIKSPAKAPGLPGPAAIPAIGKPSLKLDAGGGGESSLGLSAAKVGSNVGLGASTSHDGAGGTCGEPDDAGRRQRSAIDRAFQANEDSAATSSMPLPGDKVAAGSLTVSSPVVKGSTVLGGAAPSANLGNDAAARLQAPTDPMSLKKVFDVHEQGRTRLEPAKKVAADAPPCTSCRKPRHYGPCLKTKRTKPAGDPLKAANFNAGMLGEEPDAENDNGDGPLMNAHYHSATTADSALARARDGRPADEQARTEFARLPDLNKLPDQAVNNTGGLDKVALGMNPHAPGEQRGPFGDPYDMLRTPIAPPAASGAIGTDAVNHAFGQIDCAVDSSNLENGASPAGGPAALA